MASPKLEKFQYIVGQHSNLPSRLSEAISNIDMTASPAPAIRLFLGQTTPAAVLAAADDPEPVKRPPWRISGPGCPGGRVPSAQIHPRKPPTRPEAFIFALGQ
jgi:hypothetical protein